MLLRRQCTGFFPVQCCLEPLGECCTGFFLCNIFPRVLKQLCRELSPVNCCLGPLGQHCARFLLVQCCPKSIKIKLKLKRTFCCALLPGASRTTLQRVFTSAMVSQEYCWRREHADIFLQENNLHNVFLICQG